MDMKWPNLMIPSLLIVTQSGIAAEDSMIDMLLRNEAVFIETGQDSHDQSVTIETESSTIDQQHSNASTSNSIRKTRFGMGFEYRQEIRSDTVSRPDIPERPQLPSRPEKPEIPGRFGR